MLRLVGDVASAAADAAVQVPGYVVSSRLGAGGFGEVFRAAAYLHQLTLERLGPFKEPERQQAIRWLAEHP